VPGLAWFGEQAPAFPDDPNVVALTVATEAVQWARLRNWTPDPSATEVVQAIGGAARGLQRA